MITHGGPSELWYYTRMRELGISQDTFYSLPFEIQHALIMSGNETVSDREKLNEFRKKMALAQYNLEEKVREKVLAIIKKRK